MSIEARPLPLTVIGGYLGAGKTTLINALLRRREQRRYAVLVNDFGELNIDAALIESEADDTIALTNGCVCCAIGDDLGAALTQLAGQAPPFDAVLLEASGVADPAKLGSLANTWPGFMLQQVVVVVDAERTRPLTADPFIGDHVLQQLKRADLLLLSKLDRLTEASEASFRTWLGQQATAQVLPASLWEFNQHAGHKAQPATLADTADTEAHPAFQTRRYSSQAPVDRPSFLRWAEAQSGSPLRAKGFVSFTDDTTWQTVQLVDGTLDLTPATRTSGASELVLIAPPGFSFSDPFAHLESEGSA